MSAGADDLERLAEQGDANAQFALGHRCEGDGRTALARGWFARAAKLGNVAALRALAINLLTRAPIAERDGVNMIRSAAHKGDAEAAYVCAMLAAQDSALPDRWAVARECLLHAAERGWKPAQAQLQFLDRSDVGALTTPLPIRSLSDSPRIGMIDGFATTEICDWLIALAHPRVTRALVYDREESGGRAEGARSNSSVAFDVAQSDIVLMLMRARIAVCANLPLHALEASAILHYAPGEQFEPHFDFLDPGVPAYARDVLAHGQRVATFLLYLNDKYEGGETEFPRLGLRHKGRKGDALLFWSVSLSGAPDERTLHAGLPPASGEKWLLSQWLRERRE
jgi:prolyl 4-hydroxylase